MAYKKLKFWFDGELANFLATKINTVDSQFNSESFIQFITYRIDSLELKDRIEVFADEMYLGFSSDYLTGLNVLMQILGPENKEETGMFTNYYWIMPIAKYVEKFGLNHHSQSMKAIEEITKRNTGEYAIRPFINLHFENTMIQIEKWSNHSNKHVRRLASEGIRPRLPWAKKLDNFITNPSPILPILNSLKDDPSKYVQKSVANCLNDILKDNYLTGKNLINSWVEPKMNPHRKWIIKHGLRIQIKKQDEWALTVINEQLT